MWAIQAFGKREFSVPIAADDVVFVAVLKRGPTVHIGKNSNVRCYHIAEYEPGIRLGLCMSILDATSTDMIYRDFSNDGLMGRWRLVAPRPGTNVPRVALIESFENVSDFLTEALDRSNPEWIRSSYASISDSILIKSD
jgi:hypothetical protein